MTISVGDRLPEATFKIKTADGIIDKTTADIFSGRKVVLVGMPGAFTPTCSANHVPGFIENRDAILATGVDEIVVIAVNDHHVMRAWAESTGAGDKLLFLADGNGDFTRAIGMDADMSVGGLGTRSKRYSMIVEDGVVTALNAGDKPGQAVISGAAAILEQL